MLLIESDTFAGSVVSNTEVFSYAGSASLRSVIVRVELGTSLKPIAGSGIYVIRALINDKLVVPITSMSVPSGITQAVSVSKELPLAPTETLKVQVLGQAGDGDVVIITNLYDVTPIAVADVVGNGSVLVNHDYPTDDNMTLLDGAGMPIVGACIYIYTAADYTANNLGPTYIVGKSTTTTGGKWNRPIALNPGSYYAYYFKQGAMTPTAVAFVVT